MYIFIPKKYMTVKLSDAEKGLSTLVYWSYSLSQIKRCLKMESSEPGSSLNSSKLFTAAESESVIKYLVRLQYTTWQVNLKRWGTVAGLILLEYSYHSPRVPWWVSCTINDKKENSGSSCLALDGGHTCPVFISHPSRCPSPFKIRQPPGWWRWNCYMKL